MGYNIFPELIAYFSEIYANFVLVNQKQYNYAVNSK